MASSPSLSSFSYETEDFAFEERHSIYEQRLQQLREDGKCRVCEGQVSMAQFSLGIPAKGNDEKAADQETSEELRANLLEQLLLERACKGSEEKRCLLHRLIFLAKISPELADKRNLAEYWEQLFVNLQHRYYQNESITGLLLLYPTYIVHLLETSGDVLYSVLRDLRDIEQHQRVLVLDVKILVISHNLPSRLFQQWNYKVLNIPEKQLNYDMLHEEPMEVAFCECLTALLNLGKHLLKHPKSPKNLPDNILEKVPELVVPQGTISHLLECSELLTPVQYLDLFDCPINILMDSEQVWPLPERLKLHFESDAIDESEEQEEGNAVE